MTKLSLFRQLADFSLVGLCTNAFGYGAYLLLVAYKLDPKIAVTLLYFVGIGLSYNGNKRLTFRKSRNIPYSKIAYLSVYFAGYLLQISLIILLVDVLGYPHQFAQLISIALVALFLFVMLKKIVFPRNTLEVQHVKGNSLNTPFPKSAYEQLAEVEDSHWWFLGRNKIILWILKSKVYGIRDFLEVGCGIGSALRGISRAFPSLNIEASEYFQERIAIASQRVPRCRFRHLDAAAMLDQHAYDCIGSFDVLEFIIDDENVLSNFYRALRTKGFLLLTVPQHRWLWSSSDDHAQYVRRYSEKEIRIKVMNAGFKVEYCTSFVSLLLPLMTLQRIAYSKHSSYNPDNQFKINWLLNKVLYLVMQFELILLRLGVRFPVGGSLLLLASKT